MVFLEEIHTKKDIIMCDNDHPRVWLSMSDTLYVDTAMQSILKYLLTNPSEYGTIRYNQERNEYEKIL